MCPSMELSGNLCPQPKVSCVSFSFKLYWSKHFLLPFPLQNFDAVISERMIVFVADF